MIDLHCHILPGVDDGPGSLDEALDMARVAVESGIEKIAATPHIRDDHPLDPAEVAVRTDLLNGSLSAAGIELEVVPGGEVSLTKAGELDDETLARLTLGQNGTYLLVESPYTMATDMLEDELFRIQLRGFRVVLAHPERSPSFLSEPAQLGRLVERGMLCSVTAASMAGQFGGTIRRFTVDLFRDGLVHDVASDAHDAVNRRPGLRSGFRSLDGELPGLAAQHGWFVAEVPRAILAGEDLPPRPQPPPERGGLRRLRRRKNPGR